MGSPCMVGSRAGQNTRGSHVGVITEVVSVMKLIAPVKNEWFAFGLLLLICSIFRVCMRFFWSMIWWPVADRVLTAVNVLFVLSTIFFC